MLTELQNERLCRVGPKSPMGRMMREWRMMREYWVPALLSEELVPACDPTRLRRLGEDLVAFHDSEGRAGILAEACPHRGTSMALARVENSGLRCIFHGWVLDVKGQLVEVPTEPEGSQRKNRVPPTAYLVREAGAVVDKNPKIRLQNTPYGFRYGAIRKPIVDADKNQYIRTTPDRSGGSSYAPAHASVARRDMPNGGSNC